MAYATAAWTVPTPDIPRPALPKFRLPRLSQRTRALLMLALMASPAFLSDQIGYCVQRLFLTADQIEVRQSPDETSLNHALIFHVACPENMSAADRQRWAAFAEQHGWPRYPEAGAGCFKPNRVLFGIIGLKAFSVACPDAILSVADRRRWDANAANHGWTDYPQAGTGCVDP